jgi:hypothetical protein
MIRLAAFPLDGKLSGKAVAPDVPLPLSNTCGAFHVGQWGRERTTRGAGEIRC